MSSSEMHSLGNFIQSVLHRNLSQESHPIGGNIACPFSNANVGAKIIKEMAQ